MLPLRDWLGRGASDNDWGDVAKLASAVKATGAND